MSARAEALRRGAASDAERLRYFGPAVSAQAALLRLTQSPGGFAQTFGDGPVEQADDLCESFRVVFAGGSEHGADLAFVPFGVSHIDHSGLHPRSAVGLYREPNVSSVYCQGNLYSGAAVSGSLAGRDAR